MSILSILGDSSVFLKKFLIELDDIGMTDKVHIMLIRDNTTSQDILNHLKDISSDIVIFRKISVMEQLDVMEQTIFFQELLKKSKNRKFIFDFYSQNVWTQLPVKILDFASDIIMHIYDSDENNYNITKNVYGQCLDGSLGRITELIVKDFIVKQKLPDGSMCPKCEGRIGNYGIDRCYCA